MKGPLKDRYLLYSFNHNISLYFRHIFSLYV